MLVKIINNIYVIHNEDFTAFFLASLTDDVTCQAIRPGKANYRLFQYLFTWL